MNRHHPQSRNHDSRSLGRNDRDPQPAGRSGGQQSRQAQRDNRQVYHPSRGVHGPQGGERFDTTARWDSSPADPRSSFENLNYGNDERHGNRDSFFGGEGYGADRQRGQHHHEYGEPPYADVPDNLYEQDRGPLGMAGAHGVDWPGPGDQGGGTHFPGYGSGNAGPSRGQYGRNGGPIPGNDRDSGYQGGNQSNQGGWNTLGSQAGGYGPSSRSGTRRAGPKGYQRSDDRIKDEVCERLYNSYDLDVEDVSVEVGAGQVCLDGTVPERYMKHRIEDVIIEIQGVADIDNRLKVRQGNDRAGQGGSRQPGAGDGSSGKMADSGDTKRTIDKTGSSGKTKTTGTLSDTDTGE